MHTFLAWESGFETLIIYNLGMTRIWKWVVFGIAIILLGWGLYSLIASKKELQGEIPG